MSRHSLLTRLLLSHILVILETLLVVGGLASRLIADYYVSMRERELEKRAEGMARVLFQHGGLAYDSEVGQLAVNFNRMAESLSKLIGALAGEKAQLESLLASMSEGVVAVSSQSTITLINQRAREVLGIEEVVPSVLSEICGGALSDLAGEMLASGVASSMEFRVGDRYVVAHGSFIRSDAGTCNKILARGLANHC